jgi:hypothetical protein
VQELLRGEKLFLVKSFFSTFCSVLTSSEIIEINIEITENSIEKISKNQF